MIPHPGAGHPHAGLIDAALADDPFAAAPPEPRLLHIPCPNGHELETPEEMLGQDVLCPFCGEQFNLRFKDSVEYKRERAAERERREIKTGNLWFNSAVIIAVIVVLGLAILIGLTIGGRG